MTFRVQGLHHDHIDGSRAVLDVLDELFQLTGPTERFASADALRAYLLDDSNVIANFAEKFGAITMHLQNKEALELLGFAYGHRRWSEGYQYVEGKFAPQYHTFGGLTMRQAAGAMCSGLWRAESTFGIRIFPQLCIGREANPELGVEIAKIAVDYAGTVALDLACVEAGDPPEKHLPAYRLTWGTNVKRDCHAGEWPGTLENVRTAVRVLKCDGISQAIDLHKDPELIAEMVDKGIRVAMCPPSNVACGFAPNVLVHRLDKLLDVRDLIITLNPDDDLFFPDMDQVLATCQDAYGFSQAQQEMLDRNVKRGAFAFGWGG